MSKFWQPFTEDSIDIFLDLSKTAIQVLKFLMSKTIFSNQKSATVSYGEISKGINKHRKNTIAAMMELEEKKRISIRRDGLKRIRIIVQITLGEFKKNSGDIATIDSGDSATIRSGDITTINSGDIATSTLLTSKNKEDTIQESNLLKPDAKKKPLELFKQEAFTVFKKDFQGYELPEWMDKKTWNDYLRMRIDIKKAATDEAKKRVINKIVRICDSLFQGDLSKHIEILDESIMNSWSGVFAPKSQSKKLSFGYNQEDQEYEFAKFRKRMQEADGLVSEKID